MLTTNVLCMNNSNLGIMIAGNQRSLQCNYSKSPYSLSPPQKGLETRGRDGNFQRGAGLLKNSWGGVVWIFSGITHHKTCISKFTMVCCCRGLVKDTQSVIGY